MLGRNLLPVEPARSLRRPGSYGRDQTRTQKSPGFL